MHLCTYLLWSAHGRKVSVAWQASLCCGSASLPRVLKTLLTLAMASLPGLPFYLISFYVAVCRAVGTALQGATASQ